MNSSVLSSRISHIVRYLFSAIVIALPLTVAAQVSINTDGSTAAPSAILDVKSNIMGVLIPRMTTAERTGIASPATSLLVFDTETNTFWFYKGTQWEQLVCASMPSGPVVITPELLTATANDYNPAGFGSATQRTTSGDNGIQMITWFNAETTGEEKTITNIGAYSLYLAPEHPGSAAANRIAYMEEVMLPPGGSCRVFYDGASARWRPLAPPCPNYTNLSRSVHYDKSAGKPPQSLSDDIHLGVYGSISQSTALPSATSPFSAWDFNTGATSSGGPGFILPEQQKKSLT